ncbi:hypothetical protein, partial [Nostoc sp. UHCC 0252]|uniref:hypothetical protein n=1 Tax=Nostoc sp. UHCC 0252 TaxID=3110241 RepID=UPI002B202E88
NSNCIPRNSNCVLRNSKCVGVARRRHRQIDKCVGVAPTSLRYGVHTSYRITTSPRITPP